MRFLTILSVLTSMLAMGVTAYDTNDHLYARDVHDSGFDDHDLRAWRRDVRHAQVQFAARDLYPRFKKLHCPECGVQCSGSSHVHHENNVAHVYKCE